MFAPALLPGVGLWCGQSPFAAVPRRKVPKRLPEHLRWHAVLELLDELGAPWRQVVAVAVYTALRKGAIFGLERQGMDLAKRKRRPCHSLPAGRPLAPAFSSGTRPVLAWKEACLHLPPRGVPVSSRASRGHRPKRTHRVCCEMGTSAAPCRS